VARSWSAPDVGGGQGFKGRAREIVSLKNVDAEVAQGIEFVGGLDTLGDDLNVERVAQVADGLDEAMAGGVEMDVADDVHVNLDDLGDEVGEEREAGVAGSEIIEREVEGIFALDGAGGAEGGVVSDAFVFGDLEDELAGGDSEGGGGLEAVGDGIGVDLEGAGHEVEGEAAGAGEAEVAGELHGAGAEAGVGVIALLGSVELIEHVGSRATLGTADEGLVGVDAAFASIEDGLKCDGKFRESRGKTAEGHKRLSIYDSVVRTKNERLPRGPVSVEG